MTCDYDAILVKFRHRVERALFVTLSLRPLTLWALACGSIVVSLRLLGWWHTAIPIAVTAGPIPILLWTWLRWNKRRPTDWQLEAAMDLHNHSGGFVMAHSQLSPADWRRDWPRLNVPSVHLHAFRDIVILVCSLFFACLTFAIPLHHATFLTRNPIEIATLVEELKEEAETMRQGDLLDLSMAESIQESLESIERQAAGDDPVKALDILDHAKEMLAQTGEQQAEKAIQSLQEVMVAADLAESLQTSASLNDGDTSAAMMELQGSLAELATLTEGMNLPGLSNLATVANLASLSPAQMAELRRQLQACRGSLQTNLARLGKCGSLPVNMRSACSRAGSCSNACALVASETSCDQSSLACASGKPGRGGISRGRGDAALSWQDPSSEVAATFTPEALNPAAVTALRDSVKVGLSAVAPETKPGEASAGGVWQSGTTTGGAAAESRIHPQHRASVSRYFQRRTTP